MILEFWAHGVRACIDPPDLFGSDPRRYITTGFKGRTLYRNIATKTEAKRRRRESVEKKRYRLEAED